MSLPESCHIAIHKQIQHYAVHEYFHVTLVSVSHQICHFNVEWYNSLRTLWLCLLVKAQIRYLANISMSYSLTCVGSLRVPKMVHGNTVPEEGQVHHVMKSKFRPNFNDEGFKLGWMPLFKFFMVKRAKQGICNGLNDYLARVFHTRQWLLRTLSCTEF